MLSDAQSSRRCLEQDLQNSGFIPAGCQWLAGGVFFCGLADPSFFFKLFFLPRKKSANGYLVVWGGGLDSWDPLMKGIGILRCTPIRIRSHRAPKHQFTISWIVSWEFKGQKTPMPRFPHPIDLLIFLDMDTLKIPSSCYNCSKELPLPGHDYDYSARWWFHFFIFTRILGEMIQFDEHIFQIA